MKAQQQEDMSKKSEAEHAAAIHAEVAGAVFEIRLMQVKAKEIDGKIRSEKARLQKLLEIQGDYEDKAGYAKIIVREPGVTFPAKQVAELAGAWAASEDAIMQSCGQMLLMLKGTRKGSRYVRVK